MDNMKSNALLATAGVVTVATIDLLASGGLDGSGVALALAGALPILAFGAFVVAEPR